MSGGVLDTTARTLRENLFDIQETYWEDIREEVHKLNPELAKICDEISPSKKYPLLKLSYPYGATIVDQGQFCLPSQTGELIPLKDSRLSSGLRESLNYSSIPLSLILHNNAEVFVEAKERINPLNFFEPGDLFGVFESMDYLTHTTSPSIWSVTAGARSVFMIPRITDKIGHNRIRKEFGISANEPPTTLLHQWKIFKGIHDHWGTTPSWTNTILVFTKRWFDNNNSVSWLKFQKYIFKRGWSQMQWFRNSTEVSLLWSSFADAISSRNLKPRPYLIDTVKYLASIANGTAVAFGPAVNENAVPLSLIQDAYIDHYNLKTYIPTLMQPSKLQNDVKKVYYSLTLPTILESTPFVRNAPSLIEDEREIKRLLETFMSTIKNDNFTANPLAHVQYDFFHTDDDQYGEILSSKQIEQEDPDFSSFNSNKFQERIFCTTSPFFRGCIRIFNLLNKKEDNI